jgi:hypothetical protein
MLAKISRSRQLCARHGFAKQNAMRFHFGKISNNPPETTLTSNQSGHLCGSNQNILIPNSLQKTNKIQFMKFKSLSIAIFASLITASSFGQFRLGIQGGLSVSSPTIEGLENVQNYLAPKFGIVAEFDMGGFLLSPGLNYQNLGYTANDLINLGTNSFLNTTQEVRMSTLELPIDLTYPIKTKSGKILLSAAPTFTFALSGTTKVNSSSVMNGGTPTVSTTSNDIKFGSAEEELKKINWGTRFGIGYQFNNGLQLNATYNIGLTNLTNETEGSIKTHNIGLTLSYFILK